MDTTIQFAGDPRPRRQDRELDIGGVVPLRVRSRSLGRKSSFEIFKEGALGSAEDEDAGLRNESDYKRRQVCTLLRVLVEPANNLQAFSFSQMLMLAYQSVGVIYGK